MEVDIGMEVALMVEVDIGMEVAPRTPQNECYQVHNHHTHTEEALEYSLKVEESPQAFLL